MTHVGRAASPNPHVYNLYRVFGRGGGGVPSDKLRPDRTSGYIGHLSEHLYLVTRVRIKRCLPYMHSIKLTSFNIGHRHLEPVQDQCGRKATYNLVEIYTGTILQDQCEVPGLETGSCTVRKSKLMRMESSWRPEQVSCRDLGWQDIGCKT